MVVVDVRRRRGQSYSVERVRGCALGMEGEGWSLGR